MTDDRLRDFVAEALHGPADAAEYNDEESNGQEPAEPSVDAYGWPEGVGAREAWESLDPDVAQGIAADPVAAAQWRDALAADNANGDGDDGGDLEPGRFAPSGPDLVQLVLAHPETVAADTGVSPEEWLDWAAHAPASEWAAA